MFSSEDFSAVPCSRLTLQVSLAKWLVSSAGIAWIIRTATSTAISSDSPTHARDACHPLRESSRTLRRKPEHGQEQCDPGKTCPSIRSVIEFGRLGHKESLDSARQQSRGTRRGALLVSRMSLAKIHLNMKTSLPI